MNAVFRIGDQFEARFALEPPDVDSVRRRLESEPEAARELLVRTRFPTPEPVALGEPGAGYPLPWAAQTWVPGVVATDELCQLVVSGSLREPGGCRNLRQSQYNRCSVDQKPPSRAPAWLTGAEWVTQSDPVSKCSR